MKEITGILEIDHPGLSDEQIREIELAEDKSKVILPCGKSLAAYIAEVEALKEKRRAERDKSLPAVKRIVPKTKHKPKKEKTSEKEDGSQKTEDKTQSTQSTETSVNSEEN